MRSRPLRVHARVFVALASFAGAGGIIAACGLNEADTNNFTGDLPDVTTAPDQTAVPPSPTAIPPDEAGPSMPPDTDASDAVPDALPPPVDAPVVPPKDATPDAPIDAADAAPDAGPPDACAGPIRAASDCAKCPGQTAFCPGAGGMGKCVTACSACAGSPADCPRCAGGALSKPYFQCGPNLPACRDPSSPDLCKCAAASACPSASDVCIDFGGQTASACRVCGEGQGTDGENCKSGLKCDNGTGKCK